MIILFDCYIGHRMPLIRLWQLLESPTCQIKILSINLKFSIPKVSAILSNMRLSFLIDHCNYGDIAA